MDKTNLVRSDLNRAIGEANRMCEVGSQAAHAHQSALLKPHHGAQATYTKQPLPKPPQGILPCQRQT